MKTKKRNRKTVKKYPPIINLVSVVDGVTYVEEWVSIIGYSGMYQISNFGRVKSMKRVNKPPYLLTPNTSKYNGYPKVSLTKDKKLEVAQIHKLVAVHFIPNSECLPEPNHIDNNKQNFHESNLEWSTHSDNMLHRFRLKKRVAQRIGTIYQLDLKTKNIIGKFESYKDAAHKIGETIKSAPVYIQRAIRDELPVFGYYWMRYARIDHKLSTNQQNEATNDYLQTSLPL